MRFIYLCVIYLKCTWYIWDLRYLRFIYLCVIYLRGIWYTWDLRYLRFIYLCVVYLSETSSYIWDLNYLRFIFTCDSFVYLFKWMCRFKHAWETSHCLLFLKKQILSGLLEWILCCACKLGSFWAHRYSTYIKDRLMKVPYSICSKNNTCKNLALNYIDASSCAFPAKVTHVRTQHLIPTLTSKSILLCSHGGWKLQSLCAECLHWCHQGCFLTVLTVYDVVLKFPKNLWKHFQTMKAWRLELFEFLMCCNLGNP